MTKRDYIHALWLTLVFLLPCVLMAQEQEGAVSQVETAKQDSLPEQEVGELPTPNKVVVVVTKALKDSIAERTKLARRMSSDKRTPDFKVARRHVSRLLHLADSLQLPMATHLVVAGDVEDLAFNYERNKPALGKKTDQAECLASSKRCYLYYRRAYELYHEHPADYGKEAVKTCRRIQPVAMQHYLLTKGFLVNAGQSYAKNDLETTLEEFRMSYDGSIEPFLVELYELDPKRAPGFETYLADSTRCKTLYNCGTVAMTLKRYDEALAYFDTLKVHQYDIARVMRHTLSIYYTQGDTLRMIDELHDAIALLPEDTWFQKNLLQLHIDRQEWPEAKQVVASITALDSLDAQAICMEGQLYEHEGNTQQAIDLYRKSFALDSTQANVCSYIGRIYYNRAVLKKAQLFEQRRTALVQDKLTPIFDEAQPWYELAFALDTDRRDLTIAMTLREMLYFRFTQPSCPNTSELIERYNEVSRAYGMAEFGVR